jgi:hypothetical protein
MGQLLNWRLKLSVSPQKAFYRKECAAAFPLPLKLIVDEGIIFNHCPNVHCTKGQVCYTLPGVRGPALVRLCRADDVLASRV